MKLYTEIQLLEAIDRASLPNITIFDILDDLTPIELPTKTIEQLLIIQQLQNKIQGGEK